MHRADRRRRPPAARRHRLRPLTPPPPLLLLFDIDGTLLRRASLEHAQAIHEGMHAVYGVDTTRVRVDAAGRTDVEIARASLLACGVSARRIDEGLDDLRAAACEAYARRVPEDLSATVSAGIVDVLDGLSERDDALLSLVTGNLEPIARMKLGAAGIGRFFPAGQGGFGSDSEDRSQLPSVARARAGAAGRPHPRERTVVIGDTPRDIACARADGVHVVAVATGPFAAGDLGGADAVAPDAHALSGVIEGLLAQRGG